MATPVIDSQMCSTTQALEPPPLRPPDAWDESLLPLAHHRKVSDLQMGGGAAEAPSPCSRRISSNSRVGLAEASRPVQSSVASSSRSSVMVLQLQNQRLCRHLKRSIRCAEVAYLPLRQRPPREGLRTQDPRRDRGLGSPVLARSPWGERSLIRKLRANGFEHDQPFPDLDQSFNARKVICWEAICGIHRSTEPPDNLAGRQVRHHEIGNPVMILSPAGSMTTRSSHHTYAFDRITDRLTQWSPGLEPWVPCHRLQGNGYP